MTLVERNGTQLQESHDFQSYKKAQGEINRLEPVVGSVW